jgi:hypothetical protein
MLGVGEEHVPQPGLARARLELLHDLGLVVWVAGFAQLALIDGLGGVYVLLHERAQALLELQTALAGLKIHGSPFGRKVVRGYIESGGAGDSR